MAPITTMVDMMFHRDLKIDELNKKRKLFSIDIYNIKITSINSKKL